MRFSSFPFRIRPRAYVWYPYRPIKNKLYSMPKIFFLVSMLALAGFPMKGMAQRFNHGGFSRPGGGAPAAAPARVAPQPVRPEVRPATPARPEVRPEARSEARPGAPAERPTINGGSWNNGNHDF